MLMNHHLSILEAKYLLMHLLSLMLIYPLMKICLNLEDAFDILLNDGIFNGAYDDDEDVGAVADFNNMDNTIAQEELLQFKLQQVWILVDLPYGKKVIGTKWVFRNKRDESSIVVKNKARHVAQGFRQEEGQRFFYQEVSAVHEKPNTPDLFRWKWETARVRIFKDCLGLREYLLEDVNTLKQPKLTVFL
ncbi:putative ribonuclease H-like domain-containing protein [Tanacetum coccineum]